MAKSKRMTATEKKYLLKRLTSMTEEARKECTDLAYSYISAKDSFMRNLIKGEDSDTTLQKAIERHIGTCGYESLLKGATIVSVGHCSDGDSKITFSSPMMDQLSRGIAPDYIADSEFNSRASSDRFESIKQNYADKVMLGAPSLAILDDYKEVMKAEQRLIVEELQSVMKKYGISIPDNDV